MPKPEGDLVYILPAQKRPAATIYYGKVGSGLKDGPICRIEPTGEVYLYPHSTISSVSLVLCGAPYDLSYSELQKVSYNYTRDQGLS